MPYPRTTSSTWSRSSASKGRYMPSIPAASRAAFCMAGDLLFDRGFPTMPSTVHPSGSLSILSALSCPGAVGSPTYPKLNSFPRTSALTRVMVPSGPMPRTTCLFPRDPAASRMLTRSLKEPTEKAPLAMSQSIPERMDLMRSAVGVPSKSWWDATTVAEVSGRCSSPMSIIPEKPSGRMPVSTGPRKVTSISWPFGSPGTEPRRSRRISTSLVGVSSSDAELSEAQTLIRSP